MKITIILIGTIHETDREDKIFDILNEHQKSGKYKDSYWLCEGETYGRQCVSFKDNDLHLLTDALFVNMMLLDKQHIGETGRREFIKSLNERIIELFVTINKSPFKNIIMGNHNYKNLLTYNNNDNELRLFVKFIIDLLFDNNIIDASYKKCVLDFYNTGHTCENEIMTIMREKSFVKIILLFIFNLLKEKHNRIRIIITTGLDHVGPLKNILGKLSNNIKFIK